MACSFQRQKSNADAATIDKVVFCLLFNGMVKIILLFLALLVVSHASVAGNKNDVFYPHLISNKTQAGLYLKDKKWTIANTVIFEEEEIIYAGLFNYLLRDLLRDVSPKRINMILQEPPRVGWNIFSNYLSPDVERLSLEIAPIVGPGTRITVDYDMVGNPLEGLKILIVGFSEFEQHDYKYSPQMIYAMETFFYRAKPRPTGNTTIYKHWLKLNAVHVKNMELGLRIEKSNFEHLDGKLVIYQRSAKGIGTTNQEDVLRKLRGFPTSDIVWDKVLPIVENPPEPVFSKSISVTGGFVLNFILTIFYSIK